MLSSFHDDARAAMDQYMKDVKASKESVDHHADTLTTGSRPERMTDEDGQT
jgi:hypothetical protein